MKTIKELKGTTVNEMRLTVVVRSGDYCFKDEDMASIRDAFEKYVSSLPNGEIADMSISYFEQSSVDEVSLKDSEAIPDVIFVERV